MKISFWMTGLMLTGVLLFAGCGKMENKGAEGSTAETVNAIDFRPAFASASPETKAIVDNVMMSIQGVAYPKALAGLAKLAALPDLTETQTKAVAALTDQIKKKMADQQQPQP